MKKLTLAFLCLLSFTILVAQSPQAFNYQAVVRDNAGNILIEEDVAFRISILEGDAGGTAIYVETHSLPTNQFGLVNLEVGKGIVVSGIFADINWGNNAYFLQVEVDAAGGTNYQLMGASQLLSVPYALNSNHSNDVSWEKSGDDINYTGGNVSIGTDSPSGSAVLELSSDSKGLRLPRLTTSQIENFLNPTEGLVVYNIDSKSLNIFDGTNWHSLILGDCVPQPSLSDAGPDQIKNNDEAAVLQANVPVYGSGLWSIVSGTGGVLTDPGSPNSGFSGLTYTDYKLKWAISTVCNTSNDTVSIQFYELDDAYFVSNSGDDSNPGTLASPFLTIVHAIGQAQMAGINAVNVAEGIYYETINMVSGIHLYGGFEDITWIRDPSQYITQINGGTKAIIGDNVTDVRLDGFFIYSDDAGNNGESSYAVHIINSTSVTIDNCEIFPGDGASGDNGVHGNNGQAANPGQNGNPGCADGEFPCTYSCTSPTGGAGGFSSYGRDGGIGGAPGYDNSQGLSGQTGEGFPGGTGGAGGTWDNSISCSESFIPAYPANGTDGGVGTNGENGTGGLDLGLFNISTYSPSHGSDGFDGSPGNGGGGGGGGAGGTALVCGSYGSSGGGGGAGGMAGNRGTLGMGGGGSFGIWAYNSTIDIESCFIYTGNGGSGGNGGNGGNGGYGGQGGEGGSYGGEFEQGDAGCGGWGGNGGNGGNGGHGGGGGGGPSIGIIHQNSTINQSGITFTLGSPGAGGFSQGIPGASGLSAESHDY